VTGIALPGGGTLPRIGLGLMGLSDDGAQTAVRIALAAGYRLVDTGDYYRNEAGVGRAVRASGLAREDIFVTTKAWRADGYDATLRAFDASVQRLGLEVVDLYLIHWPRPDPQHTLSAWRALERLLADGRVRAIGVSNFYGEELSRLLDSASVVPAVNQIELHPWCAQAAQRAANARHGIITQAWGPLGRGRGLLNCAALAPIAAKHGCSPAQVVLSWHLRLGNAAIPKSATPSRIAENIDIFPGRLDDDDMAAIGAMDVGRPVGPVSQPT
jgi:diketogulonate reductase-like aldo/keto reductase